MTNLDTVCPSTRVAIRKSVSEAITLSAISNLSQSAEQEIYDKVSIVRGQYARRFTQQWSRIDISLRVGKDNVFTDILDREMDAAEIRNIHTAQRLKAAKLKAERHAAYLASKK